MSEQNKEVAIKFIHAMSEGDPVAVAATLAPDAVAISKGFSKLSGTRDYATIVGNIGAFKKLFPSGMSPDIKTVTAEGERVVVEFEGNAATPNGATYANQYCMVFTLRDGKITQLNEYFCTKLAEDVLWTQFQALGNEIPLS